MSILPRCTCGRLGSGFGEFSTYCPRHGSSARWMQQRLAQRAADLLKLREVARTRPAHGGYPDAPARTQAEIDRDSDGELLIDWSPGKGRMLSMTLRDDGRLSYAFTWDGEKAHGTAQMPDAEPRG